MSFADIVTTEVPPLSLVDNNLTMEEHEECGNEVCKPNPEDIPSGKMLNFNLMPIQHDFWVLQVKFYFFGVGESKVQELCLRNT